MWTLLIGCAPGAYTADEARIVHEAVSSVNADTYAVLYALAAGAPDAPAETAGDAPAGTAAAPDTLTWSNEPDGGRFEGAIEGPGSWTGRVEVDGGYTLSVTGASAGQVDWALDATYVDVAYGPLRLDGDIAWTIQAASDGSASSHRSAVVGDIVTRGRVVGAGALDYVTTVSLSGGRYQVDTRGTVGGQDISASYDATAFAL